MSQAADNHLRSGDLEAARADLVATIKRAPSDEGARMFLFQLLCISGEWDKAVAQLRTLAQLSADAQMLSTVYSQAIDAEKLRAAAFAGRGEFPVLIDDQPWANDLSAALQAFAQGRVAEGETRRDAAFDAAPDTPGEADGQSFAWISDADARFGPTLEMILYGRWGLMPFAAIESLTFEGTQDLRDIVWAPAQIRLRTGLSAAVLLPARYPGSDSGDAELKLARATRWQEGPSGEIGLGQRLFSFDAGDDAGILSLSRLSFT